MDNLLSEALAFAKLDLKVFPLIPNQKRPIKDMSYLNASNDQEEVFNIFCNEELYNIGINLKEAGLIVLDLDRHSEQQNGLAWLASKTNDSLQDDCVVSTPRNGMHVYYLLNGIEVPNKLEIADGVEILTDFCTLPPSYIDIPKDNIRGSYKLVSGSFEDIQPIPTWLVKEIQVKQGKTVKTLNIDDTGRSKKFYTTSLLEEITQGVQKSQRNVWLTKITGKLLNLGMDPALAYQFLMVVNENFIQPPLSDKEVNAIFKSILKRESQKKGG